MVLSLFLLLTTFPFPPPGNPKKKKGEGERRRHTQRQLILLLGASKECVVDCADAGGSGVMHPHVRTEEGKGRGGVDKRSRIALSFALRFCHFGHPCGNHPRQYKRVHEKKHCLPCNSNRFPIPISSPLLTSHSRFLLPAHPFPSTAQPSATGVVRRPTGSLRGNHTGKVVGGGESLGRISLFHTSLYCFGHSCHMLFLPPPKHSRTRTLENRTGPTCNSNAPHVISPFFTLCISPIPISNSQDSRSLSQ